MGDNTHLSRRDVAEKVFKYISDINFNPTDITYGNGYFIFEMGENSVVHFKIKVLHGWHFAMWIETDPEKLKGDDGKDYPALQFFCQHELNLDKFKPSRSFLIEKFPLEEIVDDDPWVFYAIKDMLHMIKRHPFISFTMDAYENKFCDKSYIGYYLIRKFSRIKQSIKEWNANAWIKLWHGSKVWFVKKYKIVREAHLVDQNEGGLEVYPRYEMRIHFNKISEDTKEQEKAEIKVLDRWFHKNQYNNMRVVLTREGEKGSYLYVDGY